MIHAFPNQCMNTHAPAQQMKVYKGKHGQTNKHDNAASLAG